MSILCLFSADPSLGKVDKHLLSQQTLMELLSEGITKNKDEIYDWMMDSADISVWEGIEVNESNEVTTIHWNELELWGSIDLQWLPLSCEEAHFSKNELSGTVDLTCLPDGLEFLYLHENQLTGTVDLTKLPSRLVSLNLSGNPFTGEADFSQLPQYLKYLNVSHTYLSGEISDCSCYVVVKGSNIKDMRKK